MTTLHPTTLLYVAAKPAGSSRPAMRELQRIQAVDSLRVVPVFASAPAAFVQLVIEHEPDILHYSNDNDLFALALGDNDEFWPIISGTEGDVEPDSIKRMQQIIRDKVGLVVLMTRSMFSYASLPRQSSFHVVGVEKAVSHEEAIAFSGSFYAALASGHSLQGAFDQATLAAKPDTPSDFFLLSPDGVSAGDVFFLEPGEQAAAMAAAEEIADLVMPALDDALAAASETTPPTASEPDVASVETATREPARERKITLGWQRDATDEETALNVEEVAGALVATLDSTEGEVCFGLFGHWGRGKTHLMRRVAARMPEARAHRYEVVWFSAWKYPNVPQVWVHLYETLAERAYQRAVVPRLVRSNLHRRGIWPMLGQLALAGLLMVPLSRWLALLWTLIAVLGVWGVLGMIKVARAVIAPARRLEATYLSPVSHGDKLGLQETIGKDLRALLAGWLRWPRSPWFAIKHALVYCLALGLVAVGLHVGLGNLDASSPVQPWMAVALWLALGAGAALWIWRYGRATQRVLLIVDDLDRCEPAHMSTVIESLKLLVEDRTLEGRVQVVALVEEETLRWAIERRFVGRVAGLSDAKRARTLDRLVAEHLQKLFIGHMRLPPLGHDELEEVLDKYLGDQPDTAAPTRRRADFPATDENPEAPAMQRRNKTTSQRSNQPAMPLPRPQEAQTRTRKREPVASAIARNAITRPASGVAPGDRVISLAELEQTGASFSVEERQALKQALPQIVEHERAQSGPRSLRSFLLQYQLARLLLLAHAQTRVPPPTLIRALLRPDSEITLGADEQKTLRAVIAMVQPWISHPGGPA